MSSYDKLVHGYVHGHIHKHKDHTHIHGHIHSHDTAPDKAGHHRSGSDPQVYSPDAAAAAAAAAAEQDTASSLELALDCPLTSLPMCEEIFCSELDDCFYTNCSDTKSEDKCFHEDMCCPSYNVCRDESCKSCLGDEICKDAACLNNSGSQICCFDSSHLKDHENSLCKDQNNDKELFSQMLTNIHSDFDSLSADHEHQSKRHKLDKILSVHYPFESHPIDGDDHSIHQAFFHTTIPDAKPTPSDIKKLADYDFHFKFSNYDFLTDKSPIEDLDNFTCKWDNCQRTVNDHLFSQHLLHHLDEQRDENLFNCEWENCNYADSKLDNLLDHLNTHKLKSEPTLLTPLSNHITPSPSTADVNMTSVRIKPRKSQIDPTFACKWEVQDQDGNLVPCNKTHTCAADLQHHLIDDHIGSGNSSYSCCWVGCDRHNGKIFNQRQKLVRHIHIHTNYKPWTCEECGSSFAVESMLIQHMRIHSGEKPFECSICGKHFATSSSLSIHNRIHTGEKPLVCKFPKCGKKFSESSNLTKHMKTHQTFKCEVCNESFAKKPQYMKHLKSHKHKKNTSSLPISSIKPEPLGLGVSSL